MKKDILVPAAGESVTEADIAGWRKKTGDFVQMDDVLLELETDKASLEINAETSGVLTVVVPDGTVKVGTVIGYITESKEQPATTSPAPTPPLSPPSSSTSSYAVGHPSPAAQKAIAEKNIDPASITATGKDGRITKADVEAVKAMPIETKSAPAPIVYQPGSREKRREKMSRIRKTISDRLVQAQQTAALLTTFNEVDMTEVMAIRAKYKDDFVKANGIGLGFMSFFTKAVCESLLKFPIMNAQVEGDEILYHDYCDIGVAVSTPRGLVVPVIRNAESLGFRQIEQAIVDFAKKGRDGKLGPDDMSGGTFTITNGGTFGSMLSTPIVNRPQSAILGMHNIVKRPFVVGDEIKIRPIMYLAVTYDHRIIDGADAVQFLVNIKKLLEDPARLLIGL